MAIAVMFFAQSFGQKYEMKPFSVGLVSYFFPYSSVGVTVEKGIYGRASAQIVISPIGNVKVYALKIVNNVPDCSNAIWRCYDYIVAERIIYPGSSWMNQYDSITARPSDFRDFEKTVRLGVGGGLLVDLKNWKEKLPPIDFYFDVEVSTSVDKLWGDKNPYMKLSNIVPKIGIKYHF